MCLTARYNYFSQTTLIDLSLNITQGVVGWCDGADKLPVLLIWIRVGQGPIALAVGAGGGCLDVLTLVYHFSFLTPSLWETARYRLKYCLKGLLSPKTTNQPTEYYSNINGIHPPATNLYCIVLLFYVHGNSPSAFSRRAVVSYWRKYVHEVLVNRLGGLSLPRKSVVRSTDRPDMTLDIYRGRKTTIQPTNVHGKHLRLRPPKRLTSTSCTYFRQ